MDFLKTLMLYMSLTFATSMQAAPTPEVTPVPTAAPAVVETAAPVETPGIDIAVTLPPAQTPQPEPTDVPEPTITPNTGYRNVKSGDRGDQVKKLQQRLIELGYLEEGSADGAFGNQTRRAVIAFQEANGLTADGIAGDATQTHLYENPNVKENPNRPTPTPEVTFTPEPTATPEVTAVPEATIAPLTESVPQPSAEAAPSADPADRQWLWQASIVFNDGGAPLVCLRQQDGVTVTSNPRLYQLADGSIQLSLTDLVAAIEDWDMTSDENLIALNASGYVVTLMRIGNSYACMVDGQSVTLSASEAALVDGDPCVTTSFLEKALGATTIWDAEESTLIIRLQPKELAAATD